MRRVISLWLPRLATDLLRRSDRERRRQTPPTDAALVATAQVGDRAVVVAVDDAADAQGIAPAMGLADARALVPGLAALPADPAGDARALARLADWAERYTPSVALDGADGLFLDVTGCAHLFAPGIEGEAALLADLLRRVRRSGLSAHAGLADTPGAAWALARFAGQGEDGVIAAPDQAEPLLDPLPTAALRLAPDAVAGMARVGLRRIADLCRQERQSGRAPLAARFGPVVWRRLDQARGRAEEAIAPRRPSAPHHARTAFAEPIATAAGIARAAGQLIETLAARFAADGVGARRIAIAFFRVDAQAQWLEIGTARPSRDPRHLFRLLEEKLGQVDPGFGIDLVELSAPEVETLAAAQIDFPSADAPPAHNAAASSLAELVDRLENRLGSGRVGRLAPRESHAPERAVQAAAALAPPAGAEWTLPPRPLRLFPRPEPVDVIAGAASAPSLFRWRAHLHRVCTAEGPERLAPEWWLADAPRTTRDYWRVEDEAGRRFWLFQESGVRSQKSEDRKNTWFLHGEFA